MSTGRLAPTDGTDTVPVVCNWIGCSGAGSSLGGSGRFNFKGVEKGSAESKDEGLESTF